MKGYSPGCSKEVQKAQITLLKSIHYVITPDIQYRKVACIDRIQHICRTMPQSGSLLDLSTQQFIYHSSAYSDRLGKAAINELNTDNLRQLKEFYHEDDKYTNEETDLIFLESLLSLPRKQQQQLLTVCFRRLKNRTGNSDIYLISSHVGAFDAAGNPWLIIVYTEIQHHCKPKLYNHQRTAVLLHEYDNSVEKRLKINNPNALSAKQLKALAAACNCCDTEKPCEIVNCKETTYQSHLDKCRIKLNANNMQMLCMLGSKLRLVK